MSIFATSPPLLPVLLSLLMYASPVIYPLRLVKDKLLTHHAAGEWSDALYTLYTLNPLAGIIDAFQRVVLRRPAAGFLHNVARPSRDLLLPAAQLPLLQAG